MRLPEDIIWSPLPDTCYIKEKLPKKYIILHHTASGGNPFSVLEYWKQQANKVSTPFVIARGDGQNYKDGDIIQCFASDLSCWHLGLKTQHLIKGGATSKELNWGAIGIELCCYGGLTLKNNKLITYDGTIISETDAVEYNPKFRGYSWFHKYTDAQITTCHELIVFLSNKYNIDRKYKGIGIFDIDNKFLGGKESGIFTHCSCRPATDKQDIHPQKEMIEMLQSL